MTDCIDTPGQPVSAFIAGDEQEETVEVEGRFRYVMTSGDEGEEPRLVLGVDRLRRGRQSEWETPEPIEGIEDPGGPFVRSYPLRRVAWLGSRERAGTG